MSIQPTRSKAEIAAARRFASMGGRARAAKHPMTREQMAELGRMSGRARRLKAVCLQLDKDRKALGF